MSRIDELIKQYCPDGAPHETVGAVTEKVLNINWKIASESTFNYIDLSSVDRNRINSVETSLIDAVNAPSRAQQIVRYGDVLFGTTRPMLQRFAYIGEELDGSIASTGYCVLRVNEHRMLSRFLFHSIQTLNFMSYIEVNQQGASYPAISDAMIRNYVLPVPPIEVQREIVDILDKFTQLEAELEAELEARRKQYEYYRNELLNVESNDTESHLGTLLAEQNSAGLEYKTLAVLLVAIPRGKRLTKSNLAEDGSIPVFHGGLDPIGFHDEANTPGETVMVINTGASSGTVGWSDEPFWCSDGCFALPHSDAVLPRYLYYCALQNQQYFVDRVRKAGIPTLAASSVLALKIPVPPIDVQRDIVRILDHFSTLTSDISIGLPAEIEARRKQYEYYRDQLLSFKELDVA